MVKTAVSVWDQISTASYNTLTQVINRCVRPRKVRKVSAAAVTSLGLSSHFPSHSSIWSEPITNAAGRRSEIFRAFSRDRSAAVSETVALARRQRSFIADSSISAGSILKSNPAARNKAAREGLADARMRSGLFSSRIRVSLPLENL